ncbi:2-succinyl-5-enolpyruvyl-6-hydroxy-3-cyclohexene-1-carboxylic-acid synthase, partial [Aquiflexum sp.]|uniref:2-succinyl-5-enolpyruvyl-6-hydroxy-3- cyclohexene-1-carboxylic-acid synthase n=1 Tax=Aquiflexum sp. TaxID=1872584 RepID=UPI0035949006
MILQPIIDLVSLCHQKGISNAVLSPGSRCAPITLAFTRHKGFHCRIISDERSAAFIALGMAQQLSHPVVIVCTSGSAAYNYAPAVAEAFFQQVPLLVITADRPPEWIDQWDGQTIRQTNIYGQHVKGSFHFPDEYGHPDKVWHANRLANEAINLAMQFPQGPVHINIPLREPFYPESNEEFSFTDVRSIEAIDFEKSLSNEARSILSVSLEKFEKILIVPGQQRPDQDIQKLLDDISAKGKAVVVSDTISNMQSKHTVVFHDHFVAYSNPEQNPDLIISFGKSIISKSLKLFLRNSKATHWHIQPNGYTPDPYQSLTKTIPCEPDSFLQLLLKEDRASNPSFLESWKKQDQKIAELLPHLLKKVKFGEYSAMAKCLEYIPDQSKLHVANSMAVRYLNFLGARKQEIICNRGTSGIDGSNSAAVGCTFTTKEPVTLIIGDMAFFYDRNAFWH